MNINQDDYDLIPTGLESGRYPGLSHLFFSNWPSWTGIGRFSYFSFMVQLTFIIALACAVVAQMVSLPTFLSFSPKGAYAIALITSATLFLVMLIGFLLLFIKNRPSFTKKAVLNSIFSGLLRVCRFPYC